MAFWDGHQWLPLRAQPARPRTRSAADWIATLVMLMGVAVLVVGGAARAAVATLDFDPPSAPAGTKVRVTSQGLPPLTLVQLEWDGTSDGMPKTRTSNRGDLAVKFQVPASTGGSHQVTVTALASRGARTAGIAAGTVLAAGIFIVSAGASSPTPSPGDGTPVAGTPTADPGTPAATPMPGTPTPGPSLSPTPTPVPVATSSATAPATPTATSPTPTPTATSTPTATPTPSLVTPVPTPTPTPTPSETTWTTVVNDQFNSGGVPAHWGLYDGPYGSGPRNCATPSHVSVSGGSMHMLMRYETSGRCGAGWYTAGMYAKVGSSVDQRVTVRFRVVSDGVTAHRIIPMRWPTGGTWPDDGEEDYCEGSTLTGCWTFLHYGASNQQISHSYSFDLTQWHTLRFERRDFVVRAYIDDLTNPVWTYVGSPTTLPATLKHVVLQQECKATGCPSGTAGTEDIQIDWITIEVPGD